MSVNSLSVLPKKVLDAVEQGKPQCQAVAHEGRALTVELTAPAIGTDKVLDYVRRYVDHAERQDQLCPGR